MLDFIQRQTDFYTDASEKMDVIHERIGMSFLPIGIDKNTGRIVKFIEIQFGYVDCENLITHGIIQVRL